MHLAYLYLLHAELTRDHVDFRYRRRDNPRRLERVDGEPKRWELAKCVAHRWEADHPVRRNIEFFIALQNKIEHGYASKSDLALTVALSGHAQALLLNFEEELLTQFGPDASLSTRLRFPVFVGSFTDTGEATLRRPRTSLPGPLRRFIAEYQAGLPAEVTNDQRYELRPRIVNELAKRDPDALAVQFTRYDDLSDAEKQAVEQLGRKGLVIVREQQRAVLNHQLLKPRQVVAHVAAQVPSPSTWATSSPRGRHSAYDLKRGRNVRSAPTRSTACTTRCTATTATPRHTSTSSSRAEDRVGLA
jgi:Domain of unknown function (DUF3644)